MPRISYLDNLKAVAIILVVMVHASVTYSGIGMWFYTEPGDLGIPTYYFFLFFESLAQAFFMSLLFAIAGYFVPDSLAKRGTAKFITSRAYRLGLPALIFALILFPICERLSNPAFTLDHYLHGLVTFQFLRWTGPLWFTVALLLFSLLYLALRKGCDQIAEKYSFRVTTRNVLGLILCISLVAFLIRLVFPIGSSVLNLQFSFFSAYLFLFFLGIFGRQKGFALQIDFSMGKKWLMIAIFVGIPWWIAMMYFGISVHGHDRNITLLEGGWNVVALSYAFWESFFCVTFILGLIGVFKHAFNTQNAFQKFLSTNSFAVYVFHAPILIGTSLLLEPFTWPPILKWVVLFLIVLPVTYLFVYFFRKIPLIRKLFS